MSVQTTYFDSMVLFSQCILLGNVATLIYRFLVSLAFFQTVTLKQHLKNCCQPENIFEYPELLFGSLLEEFLFRVPLLLSTNVVFDAFSTFGFGLMHYFCNNSSYESKIIAFGEVIGTSFFGYAATQCVIQHGFPGLLITCCVHVSMNFSIQFVQRRLTDQKNILYVDEHGVLHRYVIFKGSILCNILREIFH